MPLLSSVNLPHRVGLGVSTRAHSKPLEQPVHPGGLSVSGSSTYLLIPAGEVDAWPGQRERATAILLACRHLPLSFLSSPGQRAVLLAEAARTLEKAGDRRSCNDCQQMIVKLGGGTAIAAS